PGLRGDPEHQPCLQPCRGAHQRVQGPPPDHPVHPAARQREAVPLRAAGGRRGRGDTPPSRQEPARPLPCVPVVDRQRLRRDREGSQPQAHRPAQEAAG
ncbi:unnamed protein product, partial [Ectocarpus fasciculatus]